MTKQPGLLARLNNAVRHRVRAWLFPDARPYRFSISAEGVEDFRRRIIEVRSSAIPALEMQVPGLSAAMDAAEARCRCGGPSA